MRRFQHRVGQRPERPVGWVYGDTVTLSSGSPTSVDFDVAALVTAGHTEFELMLRDASQNSANQVLALQIGDAGGIESSGYTGVESRVGASANDSAVYTGGHFELTEAVQFDADDTIMGKVKLCVFLGNIWFLEAMLAKPTTSISNYVSVGQKQLSQPLETIRLTTEAGTAVFDGGTAQLRSRI